MIEKEVEYAVDDSVELRPSSALRVDARDRILNITRQFKLEPEISQSQLPAITSANIQLPADDVMAEEATTTSDVEASENYLTEGLNLITEHIRELPKKKVHISITWLLGLGVTVFALAASVIYFEFLASPVPAANTGTPLTTQVTLQADKKRCPQ